MAWGMIGGAAVSLVGGKLLNGKQKNVSSSQTSEPPAWMRQYLDGSGGIYPEAARMYGQSQFSPEMQQAVTNQLGLLDSRASQFPQFSNLSNALMNGGYDFNPASIANIQGAPQITAQSPTASMVGAVPQGQAAQAAFGTAAPALQSGTALASYMGAPNQAVNVGPQSQQFATMVSPSERGTASLMGMPDKTSASLLAPFQNINPTARTTPNMVAGVGNANAAQINSQAVDPTGAFLSLGGANPLAALQQGLSGGVNTSTLDPVVKSAMRRMTESFNESVMPGINQGAIAAGQYGGSRQGVAQGLAAKGLANALSDTSANMYNQAFQQSEQNRINTANNLASLGLNNAQQNASRDITAQQTNAAALNAMNQFNASNELQRQMANAAAGNQSDQFNAGTANDFAQFNAVNAMDANKFNAANQNNMAQFNTTNAMDANRFNAGAQNDFSQFNIANNNANNQFNAGAQNNMTQFNAGNDLQRQLANMGATNDMNQFNLGNQLDLSKFNASALNDTSRMNTAAQNDFSQFNMANALANHQFNANSQNNMNQFNLGNQFQAQRDNTSALNNMAQFNAGNNLQAQGMNANNMMDLQQFNAGLGFQNNQQGMQASQNNMQNRLQGLDVLNAGNSMQDNAYSQRMGLLDAPNSFNWNNLNNYARIIQPGANVGGSQTSQTPYFQDYAGQAMGGALAGGQLMNLYKNPTGPQTAYNTNPGYGPSYNTPYRGR